MKIGFTGTREGMSKQQRDALYKLLCDIPWGVPHEFHHGDCVGADAEACNLAWRLKNAGHNLQIHCHPPIISKRRAYCRCDVMHPIKEYLIRNHNIVEACDILIAAPISATDHWGRPSGTWATIKYAEKRKATLILPRNKLAWTKNVSLNQIALRCPGIVSV
jgi:hypothetical protein